MCGTVLAHDPGKAASGDQLTRRRRVRNQPRFRALRRSTIAPRVARQPGRGLDGVAEVCRRTPWQPSCTPPVCALVDSDRHRYRTQPISAHMSVTPGRYRGWHEDGDPPRRRWGRRRPVRGRARKGRSEALRHRHEGGRHQPHPPPSLTPYTGPSRERTASNASPRVRSRAAGTHQR